MTLVSPTIKAIGQSAFSRLAADRRGVAAIEFALIAPVLIAMWAAVIVLAQAVMVQQRANHMTSAVGDLVAQQSSLSSGYVTNAFAAAALIMAPMTPTYAQRVTSVVVQSNGQATVAWSCANNGLTPWTAGVVLAPPSGVVTTTAGDSAIYSEGGTTFNSPLTDGFLPSGFFFYTQFWLKPRSGSAIAAPSSC